MQSISPVTTNQLLAAGQVPLVKVEIYVSAAWINLNDLDSKNYVEDWSISLGGASMTPNPVGGTWNITLSNENSIFHPQHPSSAYTGYFVTGRKVRISIGGTYGGTDYYWQRIIGYMDEPRFDGVSFKVSISGGDYMKFLQDAELRSPGNYWGASQTFNSIASDGKVGSEIYAENDAMDINNELDEVPNWTKTNCTFVSISDAGGGSSYVGKMVVTGDQPDPIAKNTNVGTAVAGKEYKVTFKYIRQSGSGIANFEIWQSAGMCDSFYGLNSDSWVEESFYFTALESGPIEIWLRGGQIGDEFRFDQFSIWEYISADERYYELPVASKGAYYVTLDSGAGAVPIWQGEEDEGWFEETGTRRVFFDRNKTVANGTNNLVVYYFTATAMEDVIADLLVIAGLYADRAAALVAMDYIDPAIDIDQVYFKAGSKVLDAIRKICERCDYRFYFGYDGTPVFKPTPTPGAADFTFTDQKHIASALNYQDRAEIWNRIVIEGKKQAEPVNRDETMPPELKGEDYDQTSIDLYGERTKTIKNHLFQTQAAIDAMCTSLKNEHKNPKWYCDLEIPYNPVPLEFGDDIQWKERLSPTQEITGTGFIRDIKISKFDTTYKCETT